jgi:hypothetical protein
MNSRWPNSKPRKKRVIDNLMTIEIGTKVLYFDWIYWMWAWKVVYADTGTL